MKIGSLCTGYGGLDMAVETYFNAETIWCSEIDRYASQLIEQRLGTPNLGDLKKIDWSNVPNVDILTAGYPCQPFSTAGNRKGTNDERHLWPYIKEAISVLRPRFVILENVRGHLSLGFKDVLKDLAEIGYDANWRIVRASEIGAPHQRARLFVIAYPNSNACEESRRIGRGLRCEAGSIIDRTDRAIDRSSFEEIVTDSASWGSREQSFGISKENTGIGSGCDFGIYERDLPPPMGEDDKLNPVYVEYMMGLPKGWVTDLEFSRVQKLKMLGNGVVPQQAYYALMQLGNAALTSTYANGLD
jgi:DNA (cytosine-5)-methyltransferase 1